jgi:Ca-activated chloride channel homolog
MPRIAPTSWTGLSTALVAAAASSVWMLPANAERREREGLSVKITSPLGRTGLVERIRIVAQVQNSQESALRPVRFFVDATLLGEDTDGPPYAVEWNDANPFEEREISVEVSDTTGQVARDRVVLQPLQVSEASEVSSVVLDVAVHDRKGLFVRGLGATDFRLLENGVPQTLDQARPERLPATFTLLVDTSQSMSRRIDAVRDAAAQLVSHLRPDDRIVVAPFSRTLGAVTGPTTDRRTVLEAIETITATGGTAILNVLKSVGEQLQPYEGRHAIVLFTDGYDEHSTLARDEALAAVKNTHATLYTVGIAASAGMSLKGEQFLRDLAAQTGGRAFFPAREAELEWVDQRITDEVQQRYVVAYTPSNQAIDGTWRKIELEASNPEWRVRTRAGYQAPKPPPVRPSIEFSLMNTVRELLAVSVEDLVVREDGVEQTLDTFEEAAAPVSMILLLDSSGSMKKDAESVQAAARAFVAALRPEDPLAVATFSDNISFAHDLATKRSWSYAGIDGYVASGGTALFDSIYGSLQRLKHENTRRVIVVLTDGRDENNPGTGPGSTHTLDDVRQAIKQNESTIFAVGLGPKVDRPVLEQIAAESGGDAYFPADVSELDVQYRRILENLRRRYVISYTSTNSTRDGRWRRVEIASRVPETRVRSRGGYFAPQPLTGSRTASGATK